MILSLLGHVVFAAPAVPLTASVNGVACWAQSDGTVFYATAEDAVREIGTVKGVPHAIACDAARLAVVTRMSPEIHVFDLASGEDRMLEGPTGGAGAISLEGKWLAISGADATGSPSRLGAPQLGPQKVWVWDLSSEGGREVFVGDGDLITSIRVLADGRVVYGTDDRAVRDMQTSELLHTAPTRVESLWVSADGARLATVGNKRLAITQLETGTSLQQAKDMPVVAYSVVVHADGTASIAGTNGALRLDTTDNTVLQRAPETGGPYRAAGFVGSQWVAIGSRQTVWLDVPALPTPPGTPE